MSKDHEKDNGHLVARDLNPVFNARYNRGDEQTWYCEECDSGTRVVRTWDGTRWSKWRDA